MASSDIKIVSGLLIGSAVALMTLFNVTDPTRSVASILLVFLMIYIFVSCLMYLSLLLGGYLASRLTGGRVGGRSNRGIISRALSLLSLFASLRCSRSISCELLILYLSDR